MDNRYGGLDILGLIVVALLILSATMHVMQLDDLNAYRRSWWIGVEFLSLIGSFCLVVVFFFRAIYLLVRKRYVRAIVSLTMCLVMLVAAIVAMRIDAPTLIYMT